MLSIKEIFDICKEHNVFVELSYPDTYFDDDELFVVKLRYGRERLCRIIDQAYSDYIFGSRESFEKYVCDFVEKANKKGNKYKLIRYVHEWDSPVKLGEFDSVDEAKKAGQKDMEKMFCGRWFTTMAEWKETPYGFKNEALYGDDDYIYVITEKGVNV